MWHVEMHYSVRCEPTDLELCTCDQITLDACECQV